MKKFIIVLLLVLAAFVTIYLLLPKAFKASCSKTKALAANGKAKVKAGKAKVMAAIKDLDEAIAKKIA